MTKKEMFTKTVNLIAETVFIRRPFEFILRTIARLDHKLVVFIANHRPYAANEIPFAGCYYDRNVLERPKKGYAYFSRQTRTQVVRDQKKHTSGLDSVKKLEETKNDLIELLTQKIEALTPSQNFYNEITK